jgi:hypothetical protein
MNDQKRKTHWAPHDTRDQVIDFVRRWSNRTEIGAGPRGAGA